LVLISFGSCLMGGRNSNYTPAYDRTVIGRRQALAVGAVGILGSQAGHLLTFQLLFGSAAQHLQSSGAHAYFPLLAKTALGVVALIFLAGMFVIGLARMVSGRSRVAAGDQKPFVELVAILFTIQLACFIVQEITEAMIAGTPAASAPQLLLGGTLGQLPVAGLAAIGLRWLLTASNQLSKSCEGCSASWARRRYQPSSQLARGRPRTAACSCANRPALRSASVDRQPPSGKCPPRLAGRWPQGAGGHVLQAQTSKSTT
jgi:hypothetical protein